MKRNGTLIVVAVAIGAVSLGTGYWLGASGRSGQESIAAESSQSATAGGERKILYYRNPMGLPDTSPVPKKDPMGMDYIPVYEGEETAESEGEIKLSTEKVQKLGVRTELAQMRTLDRVVRAAGRIEPDERRTYTVAPKFEGYVERLYVNVTGQPVKKGQPLFEVYSPELVSAQREYVLAMQGVQSLGGSSEEARRGMKQLAESALLRLQNWDISDAQIKSLSRSGATHRTLTVHSPVSGIVSEKKAIQGMRFDAGEQLYQITDLSTVWILADVFEQDVGLVRTGGKVAVRVSAYPGETFEGTVSYVYPTLTAETRTIPVRIELPNPRLLLKPAMFAEVEVGVPAAEPVLTVPTTAVIDSGTRAIVLVQTGEGRFEPREVKLGARSAQHVQVLSGVQDQEPVVVAANFLIDAESNLKAAIGGFGHAGHGGASSGVSSPTQAGHRGDGTVEAIDLSGGSITLNHGAIETLKWPAMTMEFAVANEAVLKGLKPGDAVTFEFVERQPGEWVITEVTPRKADATSPARGSGHSGH